MIFWSSYLVDKTTPMQTKYTSLLLLMMAVLVGCSTRTGYVIEASVRDSTTRPEDIAVIQNTEPADYRVVGRVHAHTRAAKWFPWLLSSRDELLDKLRKEAALLDAEVIFDLKRYSRSQFEWHEEHLMGTAAIILNKEDDDAR